MSAVVNNSDTPNRWFYMSAYAIAVKHGYKGTEEEFVNELMNGARTAADDAQESAEAAANSANEAAASATDAETAQTAAETAQAAAEDSATAAAASEAAAKDYADHIADPVSGLVTDWLEDNIDPATGYALDASLTSSAAAAPADKVGELKSDLIGLKNNLTEVSATFTSKQNVDTDYIVHTGEKYYVTIESTSASFTNHYVNVIFAAGSGNYFTLRAGEVKSITATVNGKLRVYNSTSYLGTLTLKIWSELEDHIKTIEDSNYVHGYPHMVVNEETLQALSPNEDCNEFPVNQIVSYGTTHTYNLVNYPTQAKSAVGMYLTLNFVDSSLGLSGAKQIFICSSGGLDIRSHSGGNWTSWKHYSDDGDIANMLSSTLQKYIKVTGGVITTIESLKTYIGNTDPEYTPTADDFPENTICYTSGAIPVFTNMATINGYKGGNYITIQPGSAGTLSGRTQIFFGYRGGLAFRYSTPNGYQQWHYIKTEVHTYNVGATRTYKNLIELLLALNASKDGQGNWITDTNGNIHWNYDTEEKIIYIDPGEYDHYQAYRDNNVPSPPEGTSTGSYKDWCVAVPSNTTIIGLGNVTFNWSPSDSNISDLEANIWSCLDVYADEFSIENITINANNCRYCVHDDPHNAFPGCNHVYKNVRMERGLHTKGFNIAGGFGLCDKGRYEFENVYVNNANGSNSLHCLGGHEGKTNASAGQYDGATVVYKDCVLLTEGLNSIRFQTINATEAQQRIQVSINNCFLNKRLYLDKYTSGSNQFFDVTMLNSCASDIIVEHTDNPYPVKTYNCKIGPE